MDKLTLTATKTHIGKAQSERKMEKYFGNAYRGDPGVPHADPDRFVNIWIGSAAFSALTWINPYMWHLTNQFKYSLSPSKFRVHLSAVTRNNFAAFCNMGFFLLLLGYYPLGLLG